MTSLGIITADQRLAQTRCVKGVIFGKSGIGKTSLLKTLPAEATLFIDLEAGDLAVEGWPVDSLRPRTWPLDQDCAGIWPASSAAPIRRYGPISPTARTITATSASTTAIRR